MSKAPRVIFSVRPDDLARLTDLERAWGMSRSAVLRRLLRTVEAPGGSASAALPAAKAQGAKRGRPEKIKAKPTA